MKYFKKIKDPSQYGEKAIIEKFLKKINNTPKNNFIIDIGASNGIDGSNTYSLFKKGAYGVVVEPDAYLFSILSYEYRNFNVNLFKGYVTPENVINILKSCNTPKEPKFMTLDIDGYDYFVLQKILEEYRPTLICAEINVTIPPAFKFMVLYNKNHIYRRDHFYGMSISAIWDLCNQYSYDIVNLNYVNLFLMPCEKNSSFPKLTPEEAYRIGYKERKDRKNKFPQNKNMEELLGLNLKNGKEFIDNIFLKYKGKYILTS